MMISQEKWCKMSEDAHKAHLRKFYQMSVIDASQEPCASSIVLQNLSVDFVSIASHCILPKSLSQI